MEKYIVWQPVAETRKYVCVDTITSDKTIDELQQQYTDEGEYLIKVTLYSDDKVPTYDLDKEQHKFLIETQN